MSRRTDCGGNAVEPPARVYPTSPLASRIGRVSLSLTSYPWAVEDQAESVLRALRRTRQFRQFTDESVKEEQLHEILNVARWTGSSTNWQPWRFIIVRDPDKRARLAELAPNAKHVANAAVVIVVVMPGAKPEWEAFDEGRLIERILVAAEVQGLGAGVGWATPKYRAGVAEFLGLSEPSYARSLVSIGHPAPEAQRPKAAPGEARKPLSELVREA